MNEDVVEDHRAWGDSGYVIFDRSQTKSEIKLVARAITQSCYFNMLLILPNGDQNRLVVVSEGSRKPVVFA